MFSKMNTGKVLAGEGGRWEGHYRYVCGKAHWSLVTNILAEMRRVANKQRLKDFKNPDAENTYQGMKLTFARLVATRTQQKELFNFVLENSLCWYDSSASVWKVEVAEAVLFNIILEARAK